MPQPRLYASLSKACISAGTVFPKHQKSDNMMEVFEPSISRHSEVERGNYMITWTTKWGSTLMDTTVNTKGNVIEERLNRFETNYKIPNKRQWEHCQLRSKQDAFF